jgi:hypothetical protein
MDFDEAAPILEAVGLAHASDEVLDIAHLATEFGRAPDTVLADTKQLEAFGLILSGVEEGLPPILLNAGRQYLSERGTTPRDVLVFLPHTIDDLNARRAILHAGSVLIDEFRYQISVGNASDYARDLVPPAFVESVTAGLAIDLFGAAVALLARLSHGSAAGCVAEEIVAVRLLDEAASSLEMEVEGGALTREEAGAATRELSSLFELFQDDDVLGMFDMKEPADAAVSGESAMARQLGIADQRLAAWFEPFFGLPATGHLSAAEDRAPGQTDLPTRLLVPVTAAEVTVEQPADSDRFRVIIRIWDDGFADRDSYDQMPDCWVYHVTAASAEDARVKVLHMFPEGGTMSPAIDDGDDVSLDREDIARMVIDVQRVHLPQRLKQGPQYHVVGQIAIDDEDRLCLLAGHLAAVFPAAVVAHDSRGSFFGVTVNSESFEEADADLHDQIGSFADRRELDDKDLVSHTACGPGGRDMDGLMREIESFASETAPDS